MSRVVQIQVVDHVVYALTETGEVFKGVEGYRSEEMTWQEVVLPKGCRPKRYDAYLNPNVIEGTICNGMSAAPQGNPQDLVKTD